MGAHRACGRLTKTCSAYRAYLCFVRRKNHPVCIQSSSKLNSRANTGILRRFGGTDCQYHYNDTWIFDINTRTWSELTCIGFIPSPREGHAASVVDDVVYVFGGRGVDGKDLGDLGAFKLSSESSIVCAPMIILIAIQISAGICSRRWDLHLAQDQGTLWLPWGLESLYWAA